MNSNRPEPAFAEIFERLTKRYGIERITKLVNETVRKMDAHEREMYRALMRNMGYPEFATDEGMDYLIARCSQAAA